MSADKIFHYEKILDNNSREYAKLCNEAAEKEAAYRALKDRADMVLASLKETYSHVKTDASRKTKALCHPEYGQYLDGLAEARREYLCYKAKEKAYATRIEALRSLISLNKTLIDLK